jgi:1-acyl-sn-glycerol-3-phosphate acyltransferase
VPIIPCALSGTNLILPRGAKFIRRGSVAVSFAEPIDTLQYGEKPNKEDLQTITSQVEAAVREMQAEQSSWLRRRARAHQEQESRRGSQVLDGRSDEEN